MRSVIVVPLVFRERFFGVLAVTNPAGDTLFNEADFTLMQSLGEQAALALHNAEFLHLQIEKKQLDLDLSIASGIQQMLLPRETTRLDGAGGSISVFTSASTSRYDWRTRIAPSLWCPVALCVRRRSL